MIHHRYPFNWALTSGALFLGWDGMARRWGRIPLDSHGFPPAFFCVATGTKILKSSKARRPLLECLGASGCWGASIVTGRIGSKDLEPSNLNKDFKVDLVKL